MKVNPKYVPTLRCPQCGSMLGRDVEVTVIHSHKISEDDVLHDERLISGCVVRRWEHTTRWKCGECGIRLSDAQTERFDVLPDEKPEDYWIYDDGLSFEEAAEAARLGLRYIESVGPGREKALAEFVAFLESTKGD